MGNHQAHRNRLDELRAAAATPAAAGGDDLGGADLTPRVIHWRERHRYPPDQVVYIGRANPHYGLAASIWANPFHIGGGRTRLDAIQAFREHLAARPDLLARLGELSGQVLVCWCKVNGIDVPCHGDVLVEKWREMYRSPSPTPASAP